jgi:low temperature requirement protein LtrA
MQPPTVRHPRNTPGPDRVGEAVPEPTPEKRVTWAELFFDLVFVFAVTQVAALVHHDHTWSGLLRALVVFVPIWWGWVGTSVHANMRDVDNPVDRVGIFAVGLASLFMSMAVPHVYGAHGSRSVLFGVSYLVLRCILAFLVFRGARLLLNAFSVALFVTGPLLVIGGLVHDERIRVAIWGLAAIVDLVTPALIRRKLALIHFEASHLPERFGLFVIIALGESIVGIGLKASEDLTVARGFSVAAAFVLTAALWWVYFIFAADAVRHAVATAVVQTDIIRQVLAYGHLVFIAGIIAVAVGLAEAIADPGHHLHLPVAALLYGGTALYLAAFGYTRWRMFRTIGWIRVIAALVVLALLPAAVHVSALSALAMLAGIAVLLNLYEFLAVRRAPATDADGEPATERESAALND